MTSNNSHFVAPIDETPLQATDAVKTDQAPLSLWADAWRKLRRRPLFIISTILILMLIVIALFPGLFSSVPPNENCELANSEGGPTAGHPPGGRPSSGRDRP